tara:strand:- start:74 stop:1195 length:1122 start_codon:yes stop_codon:yes gene_type:complete
MNLIKILLINFILVVFFLGIVLVSPPILSFINQSLFSANEIIDKRSNLKIYQDYEWANKHFNEFHSLSTKYFDFYSWRRNDYKGETININDGIRHSYQSNTHTTDMSYWFFGGSTTWGLGVNDNNTYPSIFAKKMNANVKNYGETGYISRQSLNYLQKILIENDNYADLTNINIFFYDGVNDVNVGCRKSVKGLETSRQNQFQAQINNNAHLNQFSFKRTFSQSIDFIKAIKNKIKKKNITIDKEIDKYNCHNNKQKALFVAESLVNTWEITSQIVRSRGGNFIAILQPVAHYGKSNLGEVILSEAANKPLFMQYQEVYPIIIQKAKEKGLNFIDLTSILDHCVDCYIDFCHVGPQGNTIIANSIIKSLNVFK